ncbi:hypothetical protein AciX8_3285 [Granulicella mallensis MP5ACTX8]|uniref:Uncharacterized protein n=1 Tax=Granulicella mallensis (strain ATCC BAA-1857 / DSM 23137 / MP5ACTX8) TaxID=682795 RepID=G8NUP5_GRAMM|nr:hypothetical protein AciX8_3285 [Granulicella mallensis MP5ACTX8]
MFSKDRVVIPSSTARLATRLAQPFTKQNLLCAARAIAPALFALTLSNAAHAQGTMDFSGAQTLMGTFNMGSTTVQSQVILSNPTQIVSKEPVRAFDRQREDICNLEQQAQRRMVSHAA